MTRTPPKQSRGLILALFLGCAAGVGLGLAYRSLEPPNSSNVEVSETPDRVSDSGSAQACAAPTLTAPTLESRARFIAGARRKLPSIPEVKARADGAEVRHGTRKLEGAPAGKAVAFAYHFKGDIFKKPSKYPRVAGHARRGSVLPVARRLSGKGCKGGTWYELGTGGVICTRWGFIVGVQPKVPNVHFRAPELSRPQFFSYARQKERGTPRLYRFPTVAEEKEIAAIVGKVKEEGEGKGKGKGDTGKEGRGRGTTSWPQVVERPMDGAFLLALDRVEVDGERRYFRTVRGRYIEESRLKRFPLHPMHGEVLDKKGDLALPLAFVWGEDRPLVRVTAGEITACGSAPKHARFTVTGEQKVGKETLVLGAGGVALRRGHVRVARKTPRPDGVGPADRWIHVDLGQQTLVAYRGDRPVLATLVSSGKEGYEPPLGTFPIFAKHVSTTMNATDAIDGFYEVEEVPWTMYYWESYALHGAYWHNDFGKPKSHGCTNLSPPDARWLFHWSSPRVPEGWHASLGKGTKVYYSR